VHRGSSVFSSISSSSLFCFSRCKLAVREYCCEACEEQDVAEVTMRGLQFELESGQQRRVSKAQERLKDAAGSVHAAAFVNVGDTIQVDHEAGFLRYNKEAAVVVVINKLELIERFCDGILSLSLSRHPLDFHSPLSLMRNRVYGKLVQRM
jgi:hypothetical protein